MSDGDETHMTFASCVKDNPHARTHTHLYLHFLQIFHCYVTVLSHARPSNITVVPSSGCVCRQNNPAALTDPYSCSLSLHRHQLRVPPVSFPLFPVLIDANELSKQTEIRKRWHDIRGRVVPSLKPQSDERGFQEKMEAKKKSWGRRQTYVNLGVSASVVYAWGDMCNFLKGMLTIWLINFIYFAKCSIRTQTHVYRKLEAPAS